MHEVVRKTAAGEGANGGRSTASVIAAPSEVNGGEGTLENDPLPRVLEELSILYQELRPRLMRMVQARISPRFQGRIDVEGVLHSGLVRLMENLRTRKPASEEQLRSWLYKKVWSQLQDEIRKQKTDGRDVDRECPLPDESVAELVGRMGVSTSMGLRDVIAMIQQALDPIEFEIVRLRILDELSFGEIAELFELKAEAVRKRYVRTLLKVRKTVADPFSSSGAVRG